MGVESPYYDDFSKLNSKVITPAIQEVNEKSDIQVEMSTKRESRKIVALSFDVSRKEAHLISYKKQQNQNQKEETIRNDGIENWARILEEEFSFGRKNAEQLLNEIRTYSNKEISASLEHVREKQKDGEIRNIQAYTATALKKRYEPQKENLIANAKIQKDTFEGEGNLEWRAAKSYMQETLGVAMYTNWIKDLSYLQILDNKIVVVSAKSQFIADWVQQHYANTMLKVWNSLDPNIKELRIVVIN